MNEKLVTYAQQLMLDGLKKLPATWQNTFKLMYGRKGGSRSVEDTLAMSIEDVILEVPDERFDLALSQIERSVEKQSKAANLP